MKATWKGRLLVVLHEATNRSEPRVGLVVSKKVGNAVVRNRVKRWLRESARRRLGKLTGVDVVLIARPRAARAGLARLDREVDHAFRAVADVRVGAA